MQIDDIRATTLKLLAYCRSKNYAGHDPYDALNSKLLSCIPVLDSKLPRLVLTQALKRSPVDLRRILLVPETQNPKAMGLFLSSLVNLSKVGLVSAESEIDSLIESLISLRSKGISYWCWGYSFPWQTRTIVVPTGTPNLVCTSFVASALLDVYEECEKSEYLQMALSAAEYMLNELYWTDGPIASFSYPLPGRRIQIYNANFLAAALFARIYKHTGESKFIEPALRATRWSVTAQHADGSWDYGYLPTQKWVDNFHTGYNLGALKSLSRDLETNEFDDAIQRGFEFYRAHFFREDGAARYFHNRTYPIDIHCVAQSIITLLEFRDAYLENTDLAQSVLRWAMTHMWDERGYFYYRVLRGCTIRTSYMRWSQAWMLLALTTLLRASICGNQALLNGVCLVAGNPL